MAAGTSFSEDGLNVEKELALGGFDPGFLAMVMLGEVPGVSTIDKFGINEVVTTGTAPEDIWEGSSTYTYDEFGTAPIVSIASNDAGDTQGVSIDGLDINGAEVSQPVTLNGTTRVALDTALWRVFRIENNGVSGDDLNGTIFVYTGTGTVPTVGNPEVRALVTNGNNQTLMALYTIPAGKVGFLYRGELGIEFTGTGFFTSPQYARIYYKSRRKGMVFKIKKSITLLSEANSIYQDNRIFPDVIPSLTDIKLTVAEVSATMGFWGAFDILLVDEGLLSESYLSLIGQPGY